MSVSGVFAPRGQNKPAQGKVRWRQPPSDALGFDHPARRASQTVAIVTARRRARINPYIATSVRLRPRSPGGLIAHDWLGRRSHCTLGTRGGAALCPGLPGKIKQNLHLNWYSHYKSIAERGLNLLRHSQFQQWRDDHHQTCHWSGTIHGERGRRLDIPHRAECALEWHRVSDIESGTGAPRQQHA